MSSWNIQYISLKQIVDERLNTDCLKNIWAEHVTSADFSWCSRFSDAYIEKLNTAYCQGVLE